jgi:hypothetical protein
MLVHPDEVAASEHTKMKLDRQFRVPVPSICPEQPGSNAHASAPAQAASEVAECARIGRLMQGDLSALHQSQLDVAPWDTKR